MNDDLDETDEHVQSQITKQDIEDRVQDWTNRIHDLFSQIGKWGAAKGWQIDQSETVTIHEELMQKFDVPATNQPILRLISSQGSAMFKPKGLWVIGANGRIDLFTHKGTFIIVDTAKYGDAPQWKIFRASNRREGDLFNTDLIAELV